MTLSQPAKLGFLTTTVAAVAVAALFLSPAGSQADTANRAGPDQGHLSVEGMTVDFSTLNTERIFESPPGVIRWTVVSYESSQGSCLDFHWEAIGMDGPGRTGMTGGCGSENPVFRAEGIAGFDLDGTWYNVTHGAVRGEASEVTTVFADGTEITVPVVAGIWLVAVPGDVPWEPADIARVEVLDSAGKLIAVDDWSDLSGTR